MPELLTGIEERNKVQDLENNLDKSFSNLKYDMHAMNSWLYYLHKTSESMPKRLDDLAVIISSLEKNLSSGQTMFNDLSTLIKVQAGRLGAVEARMIELSEIMKRGDLGQTGRLELKMEKLLEGLSTKIETLKKTKVIRTIKTVKVRSKSRKRLYYGSGAKGSRFHLKNCLLYKRLKKPKVYKSIAAAQKAGMRYCSLCEPTLTRRS